MAEPFAPAALLTHWFHAAVERASAARLRTVPLPDAPIGRTLVLGAGKAAAAMAREFEQLWRGPLSGLVVTRYGHGVSCERIEVVEAAHPLPDSAGQVAGARMLELARNMGADDLVICLMSGGGSSLLGAPAGPLTLEDERQVTAALLRSGAAIGEINKVRKHLSAIKGGRLALAAAPAQIVTYVLSDVPGDDPATVASGPTFADPSTSAEALAVLDLYGIHAPAVRAWLRDPASETPKALRPAGHVMLATARDALEAAAEEANAAGYAPMVLGDAIEGEARDVAREHGALALGIMAGQGPVAAPCVLLSGGETSVTLRGQGRGGRNAEYLLALAIALDGAFGIHALAADTDGIDGSEDNAGALIGPETLNHARARGIDPAAALADNDAYGFFEQLNALVMTGPTLTNVNDFRAILIDAL